MGFYTVPFFFFCRGGDTYHSMRCCEMQYRKPVPGQYLHLLRKCAVCSWYPPYLKQTKYIISIHQFSGSHKWVTWWNWVCCPWVARLGLTKEKLALSKSLMYRNGTLRSSSFCLLHGFTSRDGQKYVFPNSIFKSWAP